MKDKYLYLILGALIVGNVVVGYGNVKAMRISNEVLTKENHIVDLTKKVEVLPKNEDKELVRPDEVRQYVLEMARREKLNVAMVDHIADCESDWIYNAKSRTGKYQGLWQISSIHNLGDDRLDVVKSTRWSLDKMKWEGFGAWECATL